METCEKAGTCPLLIRLKAKCDDDAAFHRLAESALIAERNAAEAKAGLIEAALISSRSFLDFQADGVAHARLEELRASKPAPDRYGRPYDAADPPVGVED